MYANVLLICFSVLLSWHFFPTHPKDQPTVSRYSDHQQLNLSDSLPYPPCDTATIPQYMAFRTNQQMIIDGHLSEDVWQKVERSESFRDLVSGAARPYRTQAAVLWDSVALYVAYWVQEPDLRATLTQRDAPIYQDNDIELFIAGQDAYYELEINSFGTIYEVFFIWEEAYYSKGYDRLMTFALDQPGARSFNGVGYRNHPKGSRIGFWNWDCQGLQSAVSIAGTINDSSNQDEGWTVEVAIPWKSLQHLDLSPNSLLPPDDGDVLQMDFSRFNQYKTSADDSGGWAWSPHGVWDSHVPECFVQVFFSTHVVAE